MNYLKFLLQSTSDYLNRAIAEVLEIAEGIIAALIVEALWCMT